MDRELVEFIETYRLSVPSDPEVMRLWEVAFKAYKDAICAENLYKTEEEIKGVRDVIDETQIEPERQVRKLTLWEKVTEDINSMVDCYCRLVILKGRKYANEVLDDLKKIRE